MVAAAMRNKYRTVADFAAGGGELLRAASKLWPNAQLVGLDICSHTVERLKRDFKVGVIGRCNFLSQRSRIRSPILKPLAGKVSLVLLNPPFSYRGGNTWGACLFGENVRCSLGMAFLVSATHYVAKGGEIIAIMPAGSLKSLKDREAWTLLRRHFVVRMVAANDRNTFSRCFSKTVIVHLQRSCEKSSTRRRKLKSADKRPSIRVKLVRGVFPMHRVNGQKESNGIPIVHTTHLKDGQIIGNGKYVETPRTISGPAVLMQRIGVPNPRKVVVYLRKKRIALSDCVIGFECDSPRHAVRLSNRLVVNWEKIRREFGGTCAPYITVSALSSVLRQIGVGIRT